jgi:hypothetical protein
MKWQAERRQFRLHDDDFDANLKINWLFSVAISPVAWGRSFSLPLQAAGEFARIALH